MEKEIDIFVPGRLCLFGEHSDWAGGHRRQNSQISPGYAIVAPTNQGNYAKAKLLDKPVFKFKSTAIKGKLELNLEDLQSIEKIAFEGKEFSYIAGVVAEISSSYNNFSKKGLEINNYKSDLPLKKGLSSSASICVLVAKAFNELFQYNWTQKRTMDIAYLGETTTPSRCGRLDQSCAYNKPILMTFDSDRLKIKEISVKNPIYLMIVDLNAKKNTKKILGRLSKGFPFPTNEYEQKKHKYFNEINPRIIKFAEKNLINGDAEKLGRLMTIAQKKFDEYLAPACLEELTAPKLHKVLEFKKIQKYIYGGKGVGSQGDGSAQIICKSKKDREIVKNILEEKLDVKCLNLDI